MDNYTEKQVKNIREKKYVIRGISGRAEWKNIDDLPLTESQKACVLEWLAIKLDESKLNQEVKIWGGHRKSYDPLFIEADKKVAHSYLMDMWDGGRHHDYESLSDVEDAIFNEFFDMEYILGILKSE